MITSSPGFNSTVKALCRACLAPLATTTCAGGILRPCRGLVLLDHGLLQLRDAAGDGVVGVAGPHGLFGRPADMGRGDEVGLADAKVVDRLAGGLQFLGLGRHGQRGRRLQGLPPGGKW